ncbi:MAG: hypothetical protein KKC05_03050, partial [Nanoarchaeota archaeon]|nr:hypothetical protein [Nanoarchaeota archaeon]
MWSPFKGKSGGSRGAPVNRVMSLSSQGMSDQQIIQTLRTEGYTPAEVDTALRESVRSSVNPMPPHQPEPARMPPAPRDTYREPMRRQPDLMDMERRPRFDMPEEPDRSNIPDSLRMPEIPRSHDDFDIPGRSEDDLDIGMRDDLDVPPPRDLPGFREREPMQRLDPRRRPRNKRMELEELAEGVADEKWSDFETETSDIRNEVKDLSERIIIIERTIRNLQGKKNTEIEEIKTTIDTYKQSLNEVGEKMEGME